MNVSDWPSSDAAAPDGLKPATHKIVIDGYALDVDIGFHEFEIGRPQRLLVTVEVWVAPSAFPTDDDAASAWNYDLLHRAIARLVAGRRFNLQETVAREIYDLVAARPAVTALRVSTRKPDIYADCVGVGVELASF
ncbi:MAG TPA: dihydroneopterin aldolase [Sphingomonadaceae bacterium]|nr:dihydroneopterin aldolase [Sphingomonadaceae bacterium]